MMKKFIRVQLLREFIRLQWEPSWTARRFGPTHVHDVTDLLTMWNLMFMCSVPSESWGIIMAVTRLVPLVFFRHVTLPSSPPSIRPLFFSVTNLFLFTSAPVFCSVSLFISVPFKHFSPVDLTDCPCREKTNFDQENQTWKEIFNLWKLNWIELN